jgi:Concanavalin A-like lectin/glucanases superfamily
MCLYGGQKVIVPIAASKATVGLYTFDDALNLDSSRDGNHGAFLIPAGPGRIGVGYSGYFTGENRMEVPSSPSFKDMEKAFTVSFWMFVRSDGAAPADAKCSVAYVGDATNAVVDVALNPATNQITVSALKGSVVVTSDAHLRRKTWYHVAVTRDADSVDLYVNGVFDGTVKATNATAAPSRYQVYAGQMPWADSKCAVAFFMDNYRLQKRAVSADEIAAESFGALGALEPTAIKLACGGEGCTYKDAVASCGKDYHLCHPEELFAGPYSAARTMGWLAKSTTQVWKNDVYDDSTTHASEKPGVLKVGICCATT